MTEECFKGNTGSYVVRNMQALDTVRCPRDKIVVDWIRGTVICAETGEILEERIVDIGPEWRAYTMEERERRARTGEPILYALGDRGISTVLGSSYPALMGKRDAEKIYKFSRMAKMQAKVNKGDTESRNLAVAMNVLNKLATDLSLPRHVAEQAAMIYRKALDLEITRGRSIEAVMAASIYASARLSGVPITLDDITRFTNADRRTVAKVFRKLVVSIDWNSIGGNPRRKNYEALISRIISSLNLDGSTEAIARDLLRKSMESTAANGKDPRGVVAACVYRACMITGKKISITTLANIVGITPTTIRNRLVELFNVKTASRNNTTTPP